MPGKIGLTGGIGSGKSTVASLFGVLGAEVIDADSIAREITEPGSTELNLIIDYFGHDIIDKSGQLDRARLAGIVFSDTAKRQHLESILHPPIHKLMHDRCSQSKAVYCVLEIPLLIETGQWKEMDRVLVVTCSKEIRIQRLEKDREMDRSRIQRIFDAQLPDEQRITFADDIIDNDTSLHRLEQTILTLHESYLEIFNSAPTVA